ncbi:MAG: NAD-dependent epimerase/dehydratase family protein, partial [Planctomycetales bacterium]
MIVVTGGAGFIGSAMIWRLNQLGLDKILVVDAEYPGPQAPNLARLKYDDFVRQDVFLRWVKDDALPKSVRVIIHLGACSSTTVTDAEYL